MIDFLNTLKFRDGPLFYFGLICLLSAILLLCATRLSKVQVNSTNAWYKPFKFAVSIGVFSWTMGWYTWYLHLPGQIGYYNWATILLLGFELFYITLQAARGQLSHYNVSSPVYGALTVMMALAAVAATLYTGYIGLLFVTTAIPVLPDYYLWSIRLGIFFFVVFAFEGAVMGANGSHTIGAPDSGDGLPLLNWSRKYGDPRIAHFVGMHALQVLPLLAFYLLKDIKFVLFFGFIYGLVALILLRQALNGKPLIRLKGDEAN
jgi:hypothetical protein